MGTDLIIIDNNNVTHIERISWLQSEEIAHCFSNGNIKESIKYCRERYKELTEIHLFEVERCKMIDYLKNCQFGDSLELVSDKEFIMKQEDCDHDHHRPTSDRFLHLLHILQHHRNDCKSLSISY
jgi:hypothetical protein